MTKFKILWRTRAHDGEFFILLPSLQLGAVPINLVPGYFAYIVQVERIGIIAKLHLTLSLLKLPIWGLNGNNSFNTPGKGYCLLEERAKIDSKV